MSDLQLWDENDACLAALRAHDADPLRVERIRERCLADIAAQAERRKQRAGRPSGWRRWLVPAVAFALSAAYLAIALGSALALLHRPF